MSWGPDDSIECCYEWIEGREEGRAECAAGPWNLIKDIEPPKDTLVLVRMDYGSVFCAGNWEHYGWGGVPDDEGQVDFSKIEAWANIQWGKKAKEGEEE